LGIFFLCSLDEDRILPEWPSGCHAFFSFFFKKCRPRIARRETDQHVSATLPEQPTHWFSSTDIGEHPTPKAFASKASNIESRNWFDACRGGV